MAGIGQLRHRPYYVQITPTQVAIGGQIYEGQLANCPSKFELDTNRPNRSLSEFSGKKIFDALGLSPQ